MLPVFRESLFVSRVMPERSHVFSLRQVGPHELEVGDFAVRIKLQLAARERFHAARLPGAAITFHQSCQRDQRLPLVLRAPGVQPIGVKVTSRSKPSNRSAGIQIERGP